MTNPESNISGMRVENPVVTEETTGLKLWYALPAEVQQHYYKNGLTLQLTTGCSNACWYCRQVEPSLKGHVVAMIPTSAVRELIMCAGNSLTEDRFDQYYGDSDPFDHPGYLEIVQTAVQLGRRIFTSTTAPKGSEAQITEFINYIASLPLEKRDLTIIRFSRNLVNKNRVNRLADHANDIGVDVKVEDRIKKKQYFLPTRSLQMVL